MDLALCDCADLADEVRSIRAAYPHIGWVRSAIHHFKFNGEFSRDRHLALELVPLADCLAYDVLIPVPMHREREHLRGYNQAALLARQLSILSGIPVDCETLIRPIKRAPQVGRDRLDRRRAISGVFSIDPSGSKALHGKRVLVVDDVITTGATVSECARMLSWAGAASVSAISIARG
jgi:ComF family protein